MKLQRQGNALHGKGVSYLIGQRKRTTPSKPTYFLVQKAPKVKYISSLYGEFPCFEMEHKGIRYQLKLTDTTATIIEKKVVAHV